MNPAFQGLAGLCFLSAATNLLSGRWKKALAMTITGSAILGVGNAVENELPPLIKQWNRKPRKIPRKPRRRTPKK